jgi:hypothetical protein
MYIDKKKCGRSNLCLNSSKDSSGWLPISEFYKDKHKATGYRSECKKCCNKPPKITNALKKERNILIIEAYLKKTPIKTILTTFNLSESNLHKILRDNKIKRVARYEDISGQTFNRLTVIKRNFDLKGPQFWECKCVCGKPVLTSSRNLKSGHTKSCGCYSSEMAAKRLTKHGQTIGGATNEYLMWIGARGRSRKQNVPFNLELTDIVIPELCPVLGIKLKRNVGKMGEDSPTLDKIIPELGYVKGNIAVMSLKANKMKGRANLEEIDKLAAWVKDETELEPKTSKTLYQKPKRIEYQEWTGMPEFIQNEQRPYAKIIVRVADEQFLADLSAKLGQKLTPKTKSIWHPKLITGVNSDKRWVDE